MPLWEGWTCLQVWSSIFSSMTWISTRSSVLTGKPGNLFMSSHQRFNLSWLRETVSVISSDPPSNVGNARFTTVPLKILSHPRRYQRFFSLNGLFPFDFFSGKVNCAFFLVRKTEETRENEHFVCQANDGIYHMFDQIMISMV